jgi:hypothetical protein
MWINLAPLKVIQNAYRFVPRSPTYLVHDILDPSHYSCVVHHDDISLLLVVNKVGLPWATLLSFLHFHAFENGRLGMVWDSKSSHAWRNPMRMKKNPWVFTLAPPLSFVFQRELVGKFWGKSWTWTTLHEYSIYV